MGLGQETVRGILIFIIVLTIPCYMVGIGVYLLSPIGPTPTSTFAPRATFTLGPSFTPSETDDAPTLLPTQDNTLLTNTPTISFNPIVTEQAPRTQAPPIFTLAPTLTRTSTPTATPTLTPTQPILLPPSDTPAP